jgi:cell division protein FtsN
MEGKKVLWVLFSVTLVLVVVLAAGLFLLRPKTAKPAEAGVQAPPSVLGYDAYEYVRGTTETPGLAPPPAKPPEQVTIVVGEQPGQAPPPAAAEPLPAPPPGPAPAPAAAPRVEAAPVQAAPAPAPKAEAKPAVKPAGKPAATPAAKPAAAPAAKPAVKPAAKAAAAPAVRPAPRHIQVKEYWIQTGSYSSASRAEEVVRALAEKGLAATTSTRQLNGQTRFRVRVGPYASRAEADKFLAWIQAVKGFESSYISQVSAQRVDP